MMGDLSLVTMISVSGPNCVFDPGNQVLLGVRRFGRNENRVVAGDRADHARPAAAIERECDALRGADAGANDQQVGAGRRQAAQQVGNGRDLVVARCCLAVGRVRSRAPS